MEAADKELIRNRLTDLILHTKCSADFLTFFQQKQILTIQDIEAIAAKNEGTSRSGEFYKIIVTKTNAFPVLLDGLQKYKQFKALQVLEGEEGARKVEQSPAEIKKDIKQLMGDSGIKSNIQFDVIPSVHLFTGRTKELEELHRLVLKSKEGNRITVISQLTTVTGLGGIGKTQLAREYISNWSFEFDDNIIWLNAESEASLTQSLRRVAAEKLDLSTKDANGKEKSGKAVAEDVFKFFEGSRALFVFDNADEGLYFLKDYFPNPSRNPDVYTVITSRNQEWGIGMKVIRLDVFSKDEAMSMVKFGLGIAKEDESQNGVIIELAEVLQCFPLSLHQAISYIYEQQLNGGYSIKDYISEFQSTKEEVLLAYRDEDSLDDTYMLTTATTWRVTVDKIKAHPVLGDLGITLLNCIAYLHADLIRRDVFFKSPVLDESTDVEKVKLAVRLLVKYSMINGEEKQSVLSVHRLVQAVTRNKLVQEGKEESVLDLIMQQLEDEDEGCIVENLDHYLSAWRSAWVYSLIINCYSYITGNIIEKLIKVGRIEEGNIFGNIAIINIKKFNGEKDQNLFMVYILLSEIKRIQGHFDEAVAMMEVHLPKATSIFGDENTVVILIKEYFAIALESIGNHKKSMEFRRQVFESRKTILGESSNETILALSNVATSLINLGQDDEALDMLTKILKRLQEDPEKNQDIKEVQFQARFNIAAIWYKKGDLEKSASTYFDLYTDYKDNWRWNVHQFSRICSSLGIILNQLGRFDEALEILEAEHKLIHSVLGESYETIKLLQIIGSSYAGKKDLEKALTIHKEIYKRSSDLLGEDHQLTLSLKVLISLDLSELGAKFESDQLYEEVMSNLIASGLVMEKIVMEQVQLATTLAESGGNLEVALKILKNTIEPIKEIYGENSPKHTTVLKNIQQIERKLLCQLNQTTPDNLSKEFEDQSKEDKINLLSSSIKILLPVLSDQLGETSDVLLKKIECMDNEYKFKDEYMPMKKVQSLIDENKIQEALEICLDVYYKTSPMHKVNPKCFLKVCQQMAKLLVNIMKSQEPSPFLEDRYEDIISNFEESLLKANYKKGLENHKSLYECYATTFGEKDNRTKQEKIFLAIDLAFAGDQERFISIMRDFFSIQLKTEFLARQEKTKALKEDSKDIDFLQELYVKMYGI